MTNLPVNSPLREFRGMPTPVIDTSKLLAAVQDEEKRQVLTMGLEGIEQAPLSYCFNLMRESVSSLPYSQWTDNQFKQLWELVSKTAGNLKGIDYLRLRSHYRHNLPHSRIPVEYREISQ